MTKCTGCCGESTSAGSTSLRGLPYRMQYILICIGKPKQTKIFEEVIKIRLCRFVQ